MSMHGKPEFILVPYILPKHYDTHRKQLSSFNTAKLFSADRKLYVSKLITIANLLDSSIHHNQQLASLS